MSWLIVVLVLLAALVVVGVEARPKRDPAPLTVRKRATFPPLCARGDHAWVRRGPHTGCSRCGAIR